MAQQILRQTEDSLQVMHGVKRRLVEAQALLGAGVPLSQDLLPHSCHPLGCSGSSPRTGSDAEC